MPEVSFGNQAGAAPASAVEQTAPVNGVTGNTGNVGDVGGAVTQYQSPGTPAVSGFALGDKLPTFAEIIFPRINVVQNSGKLASQFTPGSIIHNKNLVIYEPTIFNQKTNTLVKQGSAPVVITVLGFKPTRFVEKVSGGGRGILVNTEEEVRAAGGTLDYNEWKLKRSAGMKRFEYLADAVLLIERPEICADDDSVFIYPINGKKYALAMWSMKGSAYTRCTKPTFFTNRHMGYLRKGYPSKSFALTTVPDEYEGNPFFVPVCLPVADSTPEMLDTVRGIIQGG